MSKIYNSRAWICIKITTKWTYVGPFKETLDAIAYLKKYKTGGYVGTFPNYSPPGIVSQRTLPKGTTVEEIPKVTYPEFYY